MEKQLFAWIKGYYDVHHSFPASKRIKEKALHYSTFKTTFKASKGWLEKFMNRYSLSKKDRIKTFPLMAEGKKSNIPDYQSVG